MKSVVRLLWAGFAIILLGGALVICHAPAVAASANVSYPYNSNAPITPGSLVSLNPKHSDYVDPANTTNDARLVGVVVPSNDSLLAIDANVTTEQVAVSGTADTLVSTLNGDINVGDRIAASPFNGVGMKAVYGAHIIGLAQSAFNSHSSAAVTQKVTDKSGKETSIRVGYIKLSVAVGIDSVATDGSTPLNRLERLAVTLTGHTVSMTRIILSLIISGIALIALITLVYASIYGSIISVGRNPLAKYAVFRTLGSVLVMAALTAGVAAVSIFFLLK